MRRAARMVIPLLLLALLSACEMEDQPNYRTFEPSDVFQDGASARAPVPGTRGTNVGAEASLIAAAGGAGQFARALPPNLPGDAADRGEKRFHIFCAPCHGADGSGHGVVVQRGFPAPPSLKDSKAPAGEVFDTIWNGNGRSPRYAGALSAKEAWEITAYLERAGGGGR